MTTCCGQRSENRQITDANVKMSHAWSGNKMEGHDVLNTLEGLRGRLLAERQASRVAKEQAESMGNKFVELEKKLKEEIKLRDKAERKFKFLKKQLECFNVSTPSWKKSHSSEKCENSCGSSLSSAASRVSEANETKHHHTVNSPLLANEVPSHNFVEECVFTQTHHSPFTTKDCGSQLCNASSCNADFFPQIQDKNPNQSTDNLKNDENRLSISSSILLAKGHNSQGTNNCGSNSSPTQVFSENF